MAFFAFSLLSSSYYILNDIGDIKNDKTHPEKKRRPIPSGFVTVKTGYILSCCLFLISFFLAYSLPVSFKLLMLLLFTSSMAYNICLKDIAIVDLHVIAINFLIRAVGGAVAIGVPASVWLVTTIFFSALLLGAGKRLSELTVLGDNPQRFKRVYEIYNREFLKLILAVVSSILLLSYCLYTYFVHNGGYFMLTIPYASFVVFRFLHLSLSNHEAARKAHHMFQDRQTVACFILWGLTLMVLVYWMGS
jgi:4-hydroxybenzoate polyprenyltransferase